VAFLPQQPAPDLGFRVRDYVALGRHPHSTWSGGHDPEGPGIVAATLAELGLSELADRSFDRLSGGERQRVRLAQALVQEPSLLVLDEPTTWLDPGAQVELATVLRQRSRRRGLAMVTVLHDLNLVMALCDRMVWIGVEGIEASGPPQEVLTESLLTRAYGPRFQLRTDRSTGTVIVLPTLGPTEMDRSRE
jgi:iron complex transport system ATP-binding protein